MKKRKMPVHIKLMGALLSVTGSIWPWLSCSLAYRIWFSTPRYSESKRESIWRKSAETETVKINHNKIAIYRWGETDRGYVLLLHGWSGRASQLGSFIDPVKILGLGVVSFDAPGHGNSDGHVTNIFEIKDVVCEIVKKYGVPEAIIAHSFGCLVAALSIKELKLPIKKLVMISSPTDSNYLITGFANHFRLNEKVMTLFNKKLRQQFGNDVYERISADKNLKDLPLKLLVIHDKQDRIVLWRQSEKLARAIPGAETYYTNKLGHQRLLRDEQLIKRVMQFLSE
ncbi:MAG: alpha/beta hydrolase [Thioalkalispiraceae bacterium]|jgi:pimeloyl-ACP methyl ester carboxylesterase